MDGHTELKLSLDDLLRIALGTDALSGVNTIVLHSLLDLVLKKLGCENDRISISGYDARVIEELLKTSTISPLVLNTEKMEVLQQSTRLKELESAVTDLEQKLKLHLQNLLPKISLTVLRSSLHTLLHIHKFCESICSGSDADLETVYKITTDEAFNERVLRQTLPPLVARFQAMPKKLQTFEAEFVAWLKGMENNFARICSAEKSLKAIEVVDDALTKYRTTFMSAMEEVQDMMDSKTDRFQTVLLRDATDKRIGFIKNELDSLWKTMKGTRAAVGIILEPNTATTQQPKPMETHKKLHRKCGCTGTYQKESTECPLLMRIEKMQSTGVDGSRQENKRQSKPISISFRATYNDALKHIN